MNLLDKIILFLRFKIWAKFKINNFPSYYSSHSQFGEDMVLRSIFEGKSSGFYIDIGSHHPIYYSNTYHFYQKGWKGLNIDAAPGSMKIFRQLRKRDINLEVCIGLKNEKVKFFIFDKPALNTFDPVMAERAQNNSRLLETCSLETKTLEQCLETHVSPEQEIDFLSIDLEGLDEMVLRSNNWKKFSPKVIVFEAHDLKLENLQMEPIVKYLDEIGYSVVGKAGPSFIAQKKEQK